MKDYLGQKIQAGDFIVYPGSGNRKAEYGMILYKVSEIKGDKIKATRIEIHYNDASLPINPKYITDGIIYSESYHEDYRIMIGFLSSTLSSPMKIVKVTREIPIGISLIFHKQPEAFNYNSAKDFASWIHGSKCLF